MTNATRIVSADDGANWVVLVHWAGAERTVFRGTLFECIEWARKLDGVMGEAA